MDQTVVTPTLAFNGFGVMRAAPEWKLLLLGLKHQRECQEFNCVPGLGSLQPACDLTGRVASPVPRGACRLPQPEQNRYTHRRAGGGGERRASQTRRFYNELTSFVLLITICHPRKRNKGHNHGYSERARRKERA